MSDHDFEKQVRQKMGELKFRPSDAVWEGVQARLRSERPRRRGLIWLPVLLALLGSGGYFLYNSNTQNGPLTGSSQTTIADKTNADDKTVTPLNNSKNQTQLTDRTPGETGAAENGETDGVSKQTPVTGDVPTGAAILPHQENEPAANKQSLRPTHGINGARQIAAEAGKGNTGGLSKNDKGISVRDGKKSADLATTEQEPTTTHPKSDITGNQPINTQTLAANPDSSVQQPQTNSGAAITDKDSTIADAPTNPIDSALAPPAAPINTTGKKTKVRRVWEWGFATSGGIAKLQAGKISSLFHATNLADAPPVDRLASNNFLFAPNISTVARPTASVVKPGVAFSVGGYVKTPISKRFSVSAGLMYSQYNNIIQVGNRVDSSRLVNSGAQVANVSRYYRGDQRSRFSNRYHFFEVPVQLHTQLNKSITTPVLWNVGVSFLQMFASDALLFDSGTGVYYKDDSQYKNSQLAFSTGFSVGMFSRSKTPLWIGPSVKYHTTPLFNNHFVGKKHLASASLDLRLQLNKR